MLFRIASLTQVPSRPKDDLDHAELMYDGLVPYLGLNTRISAEDLKRQPHATWRHSVLLGTGSAAKQILRSQACRRDNDAKGSGVDELRRVHGTLFAGDLMLSSVREANPAFPVSTALMHYLQVSQKLDSVSSITAWTCSQKLASFNIPVCGWY